MEKLKTVFYVVACTLFGISISIGSMVITTGLAYAEKQRYMAGQALMIEALDPTLEQLTKARIKGL